jgi:preprotein translocase subunit YajC
LGSLLPFILIALVFWFLIVQPQRRRQRELSNTQSTLGPGAEVMLGSGIYGTVVEVEDDTVRLEISPGTTVKVAKQAVVRVIPPADLTTPETPEEPPAGDQPGRNDQ